MEIFSPAENGLGDHWGAVNWCLRRSIALNQSVFISSNMVESGNHAKYRPGRLAEIIMLFDRPGQVIAVPEAATCGIDGEEIWRIPYRPTRKRWQPNVSRRVCYHIDPHTFAINRLDRKREESLCTELVARGFVPVKLSGDVPLGTCIDLLAEAEAFVSSSSGFAHICHSVGTPLFLVHIGDDLPHFIKHHVGKSYTFCAAYDDFIEKFDWERKHGDAKKVSHAHVGWAGRFRTGVRVPP